MIRTALAALLFAAQAQATMIYGAVPYDPWASLVHCSELSDPAEPEYTLSTENLHDFVTTNCGSGCIINIPPGTYDDVNVTIGPSTGGGADPRVKAGSLTGATGTILIRGTDPANPPVLRSAVGEDSGLFYLVNVDAFVRLEDVSLEGRSGEQTNGSVYDICTDDNENGGLGDGVCDSDDPQSFSSENGFHSRRTDSGDSRSCLLRVQVRNTVADGIFLRQARDSTVEDSYVVNAGCTPASCPNISVPADLSIPSASTVGRGINIDSARGNVGVVRNRVGRVTKIGVQCITSDDCHLIGNTVDEALTSGATSIGSSGSVRWNRITNTGLWASHGSTGDFVGNGIQWSHAAGATGRDVIIEGNVVENSFGAGIVLALSVGAGASDADLVVARNVVNGSCNGATRPTIAGMELGDNSDTIASITSYLNHVGDHTCDSAIRVQRPLSYVGIGNTVSGAGTDPALIYDNAASIDERDLVVDEDIQIDAATAGTMTGCTLNEGAVVSDSSGGAVTRTGGC